MFLTGKQSQHRIVIDTIRLINNRLPEDQRKILVVDLIGRDSMCKNLDRFQGICQCEGDGFSTPKNIDELRKEVRNFILAYQGTLMRRYRWLEKSMFALGKQQEWLSVLRILSFVITITYLLTAYAKHLFLQWD